jgi:hypothetical protein
MTLYGHWSLVMTKTQAKLNRRVKKLSRDGVITPVQNRDAQAYIKAEGNVKRRDFLIGVDTVLGEVE